MKVVRKIIEIDEDKCTGCGLCVVDCAEGALKIIDGKAKVVNDIFCDGLGACIGACPEDALRIVEREAEEFDEAAVEEHLSGRAGAVTGKVGSAAPPQPAAGPPGGGHERLEHARHAAGSACGCPGSALRMFDPAPAEEPVAEVGAPPRSELTQWPVQLRLLPPFGPMWQDKEVVLLADCVAAAYPDLHRRLIRGKTIVMTCPKLDDPYESIDKLAQIFQNPLRSVTIAVMEVPCCGGLVRIAQEAVKRAGVELKLEVTTIGVRGDVLSR